MGNDPLSQLELEEAGSIEVPKDSNPSPAKDTKVKKLPVMEIFGPTIQGEGAMIGVRTSFIRFGLCDYRCTMCDSMHAVLPELVRANGRWIVPETIASELGVVHGILQERKVPLNEPRQFDYLGRQNCDWVTFSGGNPCIHDLSELIMRIRGFDVLLAPNVRGIKIAVETQGTLLPDWLAWCDVITVSPKSPGMGEKFEPQLFRDFLLRFKHHKGFNVKVVVFSQQDLEFAKHINGLMRDEGLHDQMYLSLGNPFPPSKEDTLMPAVNDMEAGFRNDSLKLELLRQYRELYEMDIANIPELSNVKYLPQLHVLAWANKQMV